MDKIYKQVGDYILEAVTDKDIGYRALNDEHSGVYADELKDLTPQEYKTYRRIRNMYRRLKNGTIH